MEKFQKFIKIISIAAILVTSIKTAVNIFKSSAVISASVKLLKASE